MVKPYCIAFLFLASVSFATSKQSNPKPMPDHGVIIQMTGPCSQYAGAVTKTLGEMRNVPAFTVVIACDDVMWHNLQARADAARTNTAFTNIKARLTILRGSVANDPAELKRVLSHELEHIKCQCSLGE